MATIGQALTSPEPGWRRYDDTDSRIKYSSSASKMSGANYWNGAITQAVSMVTTIKFKGSKFRLNCVVINDTLQTSNGIITIDGTQMATFTQFGGSAVFQALNAEILGLTYGIHTAVITCTDGKWVSIDSIDIDDTGYLLHPILNQVDSVYNAKVIGDCIPCRYTSITSGAVGNLSELGPCIADEIPVANSATPNGLFYFVLAGYDAFGRKKFIPDRNLQHSISWDTLNTSGIASGSGLPLSINSKDKYTIRLMTGGIASTDKDNEWDKIIVESTLGDKITAGDNNIWHWGNTYSWVSTVSLTSNSSRIVRGYSSVSIHSYGSSGSGGSNIGFRPVLLVDPEVVNVKIVEINPTHIYINHSQVEIKADVVFPQGMIPSNTSWKLLINNKEKIPYGIASNLTSINTVVNSSDFIDGVNIVALEIQTVNNETSSVSAQITKEISHRVLAERTFKAIDGGFAKTNIDFNSAAKPNSVKQTGDITSESNNVFKLVLDKFINKIGVE